MFYYRSKIIAIAIDEVSSWTIFGEEIQENNLSMYVQNYETAKELLERAKQL